MKMAISFREMIRGLFENDTTTTLTSPLVLMRAPVDPMEGATKQYVDELISSIPAGKVSAGILDAARLPAFTGDVTGQEGSGVLTLNPSGVAAGAHAKVFVNAKGLVTGGTVVAYSDLPALPWSKIATGKPTTLSGYGITDAFPKTGGALTGYASINLTMTDPLHAATKWYVDNRVTIANAGSIGDVVRRPTTVTASGLLRCNGGWLSKNTYAALYAVIGDRYTSPTDPNNFRLPDFTSKETTRMKYYIKY